MYEEVKGFFVDDDGTFKRITKDVLTDKRYYEVPFVEYLALMDDSDLDTFIQGNTPSFTSHEDIDTLYYNLVLIASFICDERFPTNPTINSCRNLLKVLRDHNMLDLYTGRPSSQDWWK